MSRKNRVNGLAGQIKNLSTLIKRDLSLSKKKSKKGKRSKRTRQRLDGSNPTGGRVFTAGEGMLHHSPACQKLTGVALAAAAQFAPFDIPRGSACLLSNSTPSQKFSARGYLSVTVANGEKMFGFCCPNINNDTVYPSLVAGVGTTATLNGSKPFGTATVGVSAKMITTATPYNYNTLLAANAEFRLVSHGIRIKCTSNGMNRGGTFLYLVDTNETLMGSQNSAVTVSNLGNTMAGCVKSVRISLASQPVFEISCPHRPGARDDQAATGWVTEEALSGMYDATASNALTGWNEAATYCGYGQAFFQYENGTGASQSFDIELVEHWEVVYPGAEQLATPSVSHDTAASIVKNIVHQAHQTHANHPTLSLKSVVKEVAKMAHNKEVIRSIGGIATAIAAL